MALVSKAGLVIALILLNWGWHLPEDHLTGQVLKVGVHGERQAKLVCEEVLCWNLQDRASTLCKTMSLYSPER